jgi:hypothetical protein
MTKLSFAIHGQFMLICLNTRVLTQQAACPASTGR